MNVHFIKRKGKIIGMNMTFAAMRFVYKTLTGRKIEDDKFNDCGIELINNYSETVIREAVEQFTEEKRQDYINGKLDI